MCSQSILHMVFLSLLLLCFLLELAPIAHAKSLLDMCGVGKDWICRKNIEKVPVEVAEICEACGNYWGNVPGFAYCCRCSERVFGFCYQAVVGGGYYRK